MNIDNQKLKKYFDSMNEEYLSCWESLAKKDIEDFEINYIVKELEKLSKRTNKKIKLLEIGFGPGRITEILLKFNVEYFGVDISLQMVEIFKEKFAANDKVKRIETVDISREIPFEKENFDVIIAWRVLYYNKNWREILGKLSKKLTSKGMLIFTMPNLISLAVLGNLLGEIKGFYTTYGELSLLLKKNDLKGVIIGYARIPDTIYDFCNSSLSAKLVRKVENGLRLLVGKKFLAKMFYVVAEKQ